MKESEILLGAADIIERYGWTAGTFGDRERGFCTLGAIMASAKTKTIGSGAEFWVAKTLGLSVTINEAYAVAKWNDALYISVRDRRFLFIKRSNKKRYKAAKQLVVDTLRNAAALAQEWEVKNEIPKFHCTNHCKELVSV